MVIMGENIMDTKDKKQYINLMLALFGAAALSIVFFFIIYRYDGFKYVINSSLSIQIEIHSI